MEYKTHGVCAREIKFDLDGDTVKSVEFVGGRLRQYTGSCPSRRRYEGRRCHRTYGRNPLWCKIYILSRPACTSIKRSYWKIKNNRDKHTIFQVFMQFVSFYFYSFYKGTISVSASQYVVFTLLFWFFSVAFSIGK